MNFQSGNMSAENSGQNGTIEENNQVGARYQRVATYSVKNPV